MLDHKSQTQMCDGSFVCALTRPLHAPLPEKKGSGLGFPITGDSRRGSGEVAMTRRWATSWQCGKDRRAVGRAGGGGAEARVIASGRVIRGGWGRGSERWEGRWGSRAADHRWWNRGVGGNRGEAHEGGREDGRERGCALPEVVAGRALTSPS